MNVDLTLLNMALTMILTVISVSMLFKTFRMFKKVDDLIDSAEGLLRYEEDENGNPMLDARVVKMIETLGSALSKSLRMSFLGSLSGQARLEKGLKAAVAQDVIEQKAPLLNLIGDFLGVNTKQYIAKHPEAFMQIAQMVMPMLLKNQAFNSGGGENPFLKNKGW